MPETNPACGGCGGPHPFDTSIPSVVWNAVIRARGLSEYLCATCVVREFVRAAVSFTATLWGDDFHGQPIEVRVGGQVAQDATKISEENTRLRVALEARTEERDALQKRCDIFEGERDFFRNRTEAAGEVVGPLQARVETLSKALAAIPDMLQEPLASLVQRCAKEEPHDHGTLRALRAVTELAESTLAPPSAAAQDTCGGEHA